jgi:hydrogenase nickel incorporation protein HypA/HybF
MDEHELASRVVEMVDEVAYRRRVHRVVRLHVEVGGRRSLDLESLKDNFELCARGTVAEDAELCVRILPVHRHCQGCGNTFEADSHDLPCPRCGHPHTEALDGEEARLVDMEVDTEIVSV